MNYQILALFFFASVLCGQSVKRDFTDVAYDDQDPAQVLDVYLAKSDTPTPAMIYFHGGGWHAGSKNQIPDWLLDGVREGHFSVIAVEYRFTQIAPHPAQALDCARAVQFTRLHAAEWNIDPTRLGATGGSAGGHLTLWVALHDDLADPESADPVARESSRVKCAVSFAGPSDWNLLKTIKHTHPGYVQLIGYPSETPLDEIDPARFGDVSPATFASADDPAILMVHGTEDTIVPPEHSQSVQDKLAAVGVKSEIVLLSGKGHGVAKPSARDTPRPAEFVQENL